MSAEDQDLFSTMIRIENKDLFVDLKQNSGGKYLKISERKGKMRNTVLIPISGIKKLQSVLEEVSALAGLKELKNNSAATQKTIVSAVPTIKDLSKVFVQGLSYSTTEETLIKHFSSVGTVMKATVLRTARRGKVLSIGSALVEFSSPEEGIAAIASLNNTELDGRNITCREDREPGSESKVGNSSSREKEDRSNRVVVPTAVYVTSLSSETTDEALYELFSAVGAVVKAEVKKNREGRSIRQALVEFCNASDAKTAIEQLNNQTLDDKIIKVREYYE